ncbi:MAG: hypothetical protein AABZ47_08690 [Planctomycetota bacterium]
MKPDFNPGIVREILFTITPHMCPAFDGVLIHRCCSTWSLVHQMEIAARKILVDYLEVHEEGIGASVSVEHLAPCIVGRQVRVQARLTEINHRRHPRVICEVTAHDSERLLAKGTQTQVVMNKEHLRQYIERSSHGETNGTL